MKDKFEDHKVLGLYMKEVGKNDILPKEREQELFADIERCKISPKPSREMKQKSEEAKSTLIKCNLRLVIKIAKEYRNLGLDYADLISEGNLGLMNAVEKFKPSKGARLSYYASFWIKQSIRRSISNKARTIRLPVAVVDAKLKINKYIDRHNLTYNSEPSLLQISNATNIPVKKVESLLNLKFSSESLNDFVDEDSDTELISTIEDNSFDSPVTELLIKDQSDILNKLLNKLNNRERYIIMYRFGIGGRETKTLEVIGDEFNLTRERIRQLELSALEKLREMYKKVK